ncbi:MAG TPA: caspase family protein [Methylomirabilota bacterium]|nr:caspase family protein [Methylomirabilota bacterium]
MFRALNTAIFILFAMLAAPLASAQGTADTETRVALVISNSDYEHVGRLTNAENDATAIADTLERLGYAVTRKSNLTYQQFRVALREFHAAASAADVSAVYFAGHGIEIDRVNYLIPVDAVLQTDTAIEFEAIPLNLVTLAGANSKRFRLIVLDACRNNPFLKTMTRSATKRSVGMGLASVEPDTSDTLIAYAAREGTVAYDGSGEHSPYAAALLKNLSEPGVEIGDLFRRVRDQVLAETNGAQEPFVYGSLSSRSFYLNPPAAAAAVPVAPAVVAPAAGVLPVDACRFAESHWESVLSVDRTDYYEEHLRMFPDCPFASLARLKLADLSESRGVTDKPAAAQQAAPRQPSATAAPARKAAPVAKKAAPTKAAPPKAAAAPAPAPAPVVAAPPPAAATPPKRISGHRSNDASCVTFPIRCNNN